VPKKKGQHISVLALTATLAGDIFTIWRKTRHICMRGTPIPLPRKLQALCQIARPG